MHRQPDLFVFAKISRTPPQRHPTIKIVSAAACVMRYHNPSFMGTHVTVATFAEWQLMSSRQSKPDSRQKRRMHLRSTRTIKIQI